MTDNPLMDEFVALAQAALVKGPPVTVTEERLPGGGLALKFSDPGPPYADGGTLIIPAGTVFTDYKPEPVEPDDVPMVFVPAKLLAVEALMPDGTVEGKSSSMAPDTLEEVLAAIERGLLQGLRHDFPGAVEYRSSGWTDSQVLVPEDGSLTPDAGGSGT